MNNPVLFLLITCLSFALHVHTWKPGFPSPSGSVDSSKRSLFSKSTLQQQVQSLLNPTRTLQKPQNVRQRNIRDLMPHLMVNNHRMPMVSPPSFNRQSLQRGISRPPSGLNSRGPTSHSRYQQAFAMPSSSVLHAMNENPRAQTVVSTTILYEVR